MGVGALEDEAGATDQLPRGYDSTRAAELLEQLPEEDGSTAVVLFTARDGEALGAAQRQELAALVEGIDVDRVSRPQGPPLLPSEDGLAAISLLRVDATSGNALSAPVEQLRTTLDDEVPDGVRAEVTGPAGVQSDLSAVFDGADTRLLAVTATVVALLLVITYRSPILWVIPLLVVGIADRVATVLATRVLTELSIPFDGSVTGILSVLVFGAGTNYALLLISRYRDELRAPGGPRRGDAFRPASYGGTGARQRHHGRGRGAHAGAVAHARHAWARDRLRDRDPDGRRVRAGRVAGDAGPVRPLGVLAARPTRGIGHPGRGAHALASRRRRGRSRGRRCSRPAPPACWSSCHWACST